MFNVTGQPAAVVPWGLDGNGVPLSIQLVGKPFDEATLRAAGDVIVREITPISEVRGGAEFRRQLARHVLVKFYLEQALAAV